MYAAGPVVLGKVVLAESGDIFFGVIFFGGRRFAQPIPGGSDQVQNRGPQDFVVQFYSAGLIAFAVFLFITDDREDII